MSFSKCLSRLLFREHFAKKTKLANSMVGIMEKGFLNLTEEIMATLYQTLVRPHLEYANQSLNPFLKKRSD